MQNLSLQQWEKENLHVITSYSIHYTKLYEVDPYLVFRLLGGLVFFTGMCIMAFNVWKTVSEQKPAPVAVLDPA